MSARYGCPGFRDTELGELWPDGLAGGRAFSPRPGAWRLPRHRPPYVAYPDWPKRLDLAFSDLENLRLFAKQAVIEGLVRCISHDEQLSVSESELLRTTCAVLHCPLPPLLPDLGTSAM